MSFPTTLTNLKAYIDASDQTGWTTSSPSSDTLIQTIPPISPATITWNAVTNTGTIDEPVLDNNQVYFKTNSVDAADGRHLKVDSGALSLGEGSTNPQFMLGVKFQIPSGWFGNNTFITNVGSAANLEIGYYDGESSLRIKFKGSQVKDSGGNPIVVPITTGTSLEVIISIRADLSAENGDLKVNGTTYNDVVLDGINTAGSADNLLIGARNNGSTPAQDSRLDYFIGAQTFGTIQEMEDLYSFMDGTLVNTPSGTVTFSDGTISEGVADFYKEPDVVGKVADGAPTHIERVAISGGSITGTVTRDSTNVIYAVCKGIADDYSGTVDAVSGDVITIPSGQDLTGVGMGGASDDMYVFKATGGTGSGNETTVLSRSGQDITVTDGSPFDGTTTFVLGRVIDGISRYLPED